MKNILRFVVAILLAVLLVASIGWYLFVFDRDFTRDMLLQQARFQDMHGSSRISAWFYNLAYAHSGNDEDVAIELANQYMDAGNYTKAEVTLSRAIHAGATANLYTALCRTYVAQDKLMDAVALLAGIPDETIRQELESRRPTAPEPDQKPGYYTQYIHVGLSSTGSRLIYSTNGEYPSIMNPDYKEPIVLPAGETVIYCIAVGNDGLVSPLSILGYTVGGVIEPAVFMDANMETAVREALGSSSSEVLYTNHLWAIKEFTMPENVNSLEDLTLMPYLEKLTVKDKQLDSLTHLVNLTKLRDLDLSGCRFPIADLEVLSKLNSLERLTLADCSISTIAGLENAKKLQYLDLSFNTIRNLEPLSGMSDMKELYMSHNALVGLEVLGGLTNLERLDISYNSVTEMAPLATCMKLSWLNAENNLIYNCNGVAALPMLESLSLNYNKISEVGELSACLQLKELSISNNFIENLQPLSGLVNLEVFDVSYNTVYFLPEWPKDCALRIINCANNLVNTLDGLSGMPNLTYVSADYNQVQNIDKLANCPNLVQINIYGNKISDVTKLLEKDVIVNYDPT